MWRRTAAVTVSTRSADYSLRQFAGDFADCAAEMVHGISTLPPEMRDSVRRLVERDDLLTVGLPRQGNNVAESYYLYFDSELSIVLFKVPKERPVQPHDHGIWESLLVYRGRIDHRVYERSDDGTKAGFASLTLVDTRVLNKGEVAIVAPPRDIHGFQALDDNTYGITVSKGEYKAERLYYRPEEQTYETRHARTLR
jgi:predicted metal-dependent enzyme (double-stranded beta helix superfamily)